MTRATASNMPAVRAALLVVQPQSSRRTAFVAFRARC
jgi:hypothetical protein